MIIKCAFPLTNKQRLGTLIGSEWLEVDTDWDLINDEKNVEGIIQSLPTLAHGVAYGDVIHFTKEHDPDSGKYWFVFKSVEKEQDVCVFRFTDIDAGTYKSKIAKITNDAFEYADDGKIGDVTFHTVQIASVHGREVFDFLKSNASNVTVLRAPAVLAQLSSLDC